MSSSDDEPLMVIAAKAKERKSELPSKAKHKTPLKKRRIASESSDESRCNSPKATSSNSSDEEEEKPRKKKKKPALEDEYASDEIPLGDFDEEENEVESGTSTNVEESPDNVKTVSRRTVEANQGETDQHVERTKQMCKMKMDAISKSSKKLETNEQRDLKHSDTEEAPIDQKNGVSLDSDSIGGDNKNCINISSTKGSKLTGEVAEMEDKSYVQDSDSYHVNEEGITKKKSDESKNVREETSASPGNSSNSDDDDTGKKPSQSSEGDEKGKKKLSGSDSDAPLSVVAKKAEGKSSESDSDEPLAAVKEKEKTRKRECGRQKFKSKLKREGDDRKQKEHSDVSSDEERLNKKSQRKRGRRKKEQEEPQSAASIRLSKLKKMVVLAGFRICYKKLFEDVADSDRARVKTLEKEMERRGLTPPFTMESCKAFKLRKEQEIELAELAKNDIIDLGEETHGRVTRGQRSAALARRRGRGLIFEQSSGEDEEEIEEREHMKEETQNLFKNLRGIVSDDADSD